MKKWYQSSTIWINVAGVIALILEAVIKLEITNDTEIIALVIAVLNIINRFRTPKKVQSIDKSII